MGTVKPKIDAKQKERSEKVLDAASTFLVKVFEEYGKYLIDDPQMLEATVDLTKIICRN